MAITEEERFRLQQVLVEALGEREAATLMEHLLPVGWADVATRRDLDQLEERMDLRFGSLEGRIGSLEVQLRSEIHGEVQSARADLERALRQTMQVTIGSVAAMLTVAVAVLGLLGAATG